MSDEEPKLGGGSAPDPYEAKYMSGPGGALYFAKMTAPRFFHLLFLLPLLVSVGSALVAHAPLLVPLLSILPLFFVWILFSALRISVTAKEVHVQYGLFGPRIPIESIESCEACEYDWKQYGGWGIRYGRDGTVAYNMLGDGGRAVRISYKKGRRRRSCSSLRRIRSGWRRRSTRRGRWLLGARRRGSGSRRPAIRCASRRWRAGIGRARRKRLRRSRRSGCADRGGAGGRCLLVRISIARN
jgi:hypothetical protein